MVVLTNTDVVLGLLYRAPELLRMESPPLCGTQKGDVYSFSIILYAIHSRQGPFGFIAMTARDILKKVAEYQPPLPPFRYNLISQMKNREKRYVNEKVWEE